MGAAGELVVAARYLDLSGRHLALRSTKLDVAGKSRIDGVSTLAVASAATPLPIAMVGFFIKGGEVEQNPRASSARSCWGCICSLPFPFRAPAHGPVRWSRRCWEDGFLTPCSPLEPA